MISIEAYRLSVGSFNNCKQLNLSTICKAILVGSHSSIRKISGLLRPARFITLFFLGMILINSGDIETNPGPSFSIKTIRGSYHQNNPKYGREETRFYIICRSAKTRYTAGIRLLKGLFEKTSYAIMSAYSVNVWPL